MTTTLLNLCNSSILIFGARGQLIMMHRNIELKTWKGQQAKQSRWSWNLRLTVPLAEWENIKKLLVSLKELEMFTRQWLNMTNKSIDNSAQTEDKKTRSNMNKKSPWSLLMRCTCSSRSDKSFKIIEQRASLCICAWHRHSLSNTHIHTHQVFVLWGAFKNIHFICYQRD